VEDSVPYAIDFMNPAPDADVNSVGQENFDWIIREVADLAIRKAQSSSNPTSEYRWNLFLNGPAEKKSVRAAAKPSKTIAKKAGKK
jgi:hypothetical protein